MIDKYRLIKKGQKAERALLAGLIGSGITEELVDEHLDELAFLARTAGAITLKRFKQKINAPNPHTFFGKGKLDEIGAYAKKNDADMVIFDDELSPSQQNNIEKKLKCKILDRTGLILDIFAKRAKTAQASAQVELAQMQYLLPRLKGLWTHLERQKGGIGVRGPGERELETDRRVIDKKIALLKSKLKQIDKQSATRRKARGKMIRVALVGYTNVGKSTVMNILSKSDIFAEDKLFATLDTTVRKVVLENAPFLLSDTVGFIRKLPHHLVESFKSTLEEVIESDIIVHIVDISHPSFEEQMQVVNQTLVDMGIAEKLTITVFNKMDLYEEKNFDKLVPQKVKKEILNGLEQLWMGKTNNNCVFISAIKKHNLNLLRQLILIKVKEHYRIRYPYRSEFY